jgi:hypothetical protein
VQISIPTNSRQLLDYFTNNAYPPANVGDYLFMDKVESDGAFFAYYPFTGGNFLRTLSLPINNFLNVYGADINAGAGGPDTPTFFLDKTTYDAAKKTIKVIFNPSTMNGGNGNISAIEIKFNQSITLVQIVKQFVQVWFSFVDAVGPQAIGLISSTGTDFAGFGDAFEFELQFSSIDLENVEITSAAVTDNDLTSYNIVL